jgi:3-dehydroquinate dehydratase II
MDKASILVINGPNLNMLGAREPDQYGHMTLDDICRQIKAHAGRHNIRVDFFQSNIEGELITTIQEAPAHFSGIILNAGAYAHTSIALRDTVSSIAIPVIEVHISNIYRREAFRHHSYLAPVCAGSVVGFGHLSYMLALDYFVLSR